MFFKCKCFSYKRTPCSHEQFVLVPRASSYKRSPLYYSPFWLKSFPFLSLSLSLRKESQISEEGTNFLREALTLLMSYALPPSSSSSSSQSCRKCSQGVRGMLDDALRTCQLNITLKNCFKTHGDQQQQQKRCNAALLMKQNAWSPHISDAFFLAFLYGHIMWQTAVGGHLRGGKSSGRKGGKWQQRNNSAPGWQCKRNGNNLGQQFPIFFSFQHMGVFDLFFYRTFCPYQRISWTLKVWLVTRDCLQVGNH